MSVAVVRFRFEYPDTCPSPTCFDLKSSYWPNIVNEQMSARPDANGKSCAKMVTSDGSANHRMEEIHRGNRSTKKFEVETLTLERLQEEVETRKESRGTHNSTDTLPVAHEVQDEDGTDEEIEKFSKPTEDGATASCNSKMQKKDSSVGASFPPSRRSPSDKSSRSLTPADTRFSSSASDEGAGSRPGSGKGRHKSHSPTLSGIIFFSGNPLVETTEGIMHLYKENHLTSLEKGCQRPEMICMLAVPPAMTTKDLMQFVAPVMCGIEQMKIVRDSTPNQYMVLIKFKNQADADEFYRTYNNVPFNSIEPEICYLVYVASVEAMKSSEGACFPIKDLTELPNCPVCLERMDESVDGILTILCNHSFHGACLSQWHDTSCPVCRYLQTPEGQAENKCTECDTQESLWICLICGHIGCGRYHGGHARSHYEDTQHTYAMQLSNNRVWDYTGDNYVHRLIQSKGDGKLVEYSEGGTFDSDEKMDSITLEYTYLLTSQLESQRLYFEEKMSLIEKEAESRIQDLEGKARKAVDDCFILEKKLRDIQRDKENSERKSTQFLSKINKIGQELQEEKEMNKCLLENQQEWKETVREMEKKILSLEKKKDEEVKELQEQLRDVMFHLEAQQKLATTDAATQEEIQEGQIIPGEQMPSSATGRTEASRRTAGKRTRKKQR